MNIASNVADADEGGTDDYDSSDDDGSAAADDGVDDDDEDDDEDAGAADAPPAGVPRIEQADALARNALAIAADPLPASKSALGRCVARRPLGAGSKTVTRMSRHFGETRFQS